MNGLLQNHLAGPKPVTAVGQSGTRYSFLLQPFAGFHPQSLPGVYLVCREAGYVTTALYVGESSDLSVRVGSALGSHHALDSWRRHGATHIGVMYTTGSEVARLQIERDLINGLAPTCNA